MSTANGNAPFGTALGFTVPDALLDELASRIAGVLNTAVAPATGSAWLDVDQAAEHLATTTRRIYDLVSQQRIPFHREGRRLLFDRAELDTWIRDGRAAATDGRPR